MGRFKERVIGEPVLEGEDTITVTTRRVVIRRAGDSGEIRELEIPLGLRGSDFRQLCHSAAAIKAQGLETKMSIFARTFLGAVGK